MALSESTMGIEAYLKAMFEATLKIDIFENPLVQIDCSVRAACSSKIYARLYLVVCAGPARPGFLLVCSAALASRALPF